MKTRLCAILFAAIFGVSNSTHGQVSISFDYTYDASGFFTQSRRDLLNLAATSLSSRLGDSLSAIAPGGVNSWDASFPNPATGNQQTVNNLSISANSVVVFVGGRDLPGSTLGIGGPGGFSASGTQNWIDTLSARGQPGETTGATATEFGPWGGAVTFDTAASWYFDSDPSTVESFGSLNDFYSVALHELGHVLGIGTADSWTSRISGGNFIGPVSMSLNNGNPVPLADTGHWQNGLQSTLPGTPILQEVAMDPSLTVGTRKFFTDLDYAGLDDVGWDVTPVPEPYQYALVTVLGLLGFAVGRRRFAARA
jgi:hypothetical protein